METEEPSREVRALAAESAVILAHNYQVPEVQAVADFVGDSLALSTDKTVLVPDLEAPARCRARSPATSCATGSRDIPARCW